MGDNKLEKVVRRDTLPVTAIDARTLVPVSDQIGGVVVYIGGRPAFYVLDGEWFAAVPEPAGVTVDSFSTGAIVSTF